jgi:hypothetical protein
MGLTTTDGRGSGGHVRPGAGHERVASVTAHHQLCAPCRGTCRGVHVVRLAQPVPDGRGCGPPQFERGLTRFERYYQNKHSGRKLTWLYNLSKGEIKVNYCRGAPRSGFTFQVSMYQMGVLLLYNAGTRYTLAELEAATQLAPDVLRQILAILVKARVLLSAGDDEPTAATAFELNFDFKSKKVKVNLNMPLKTEQRAEQEETHRHVQEDRKMLIQVRLARARVCGRGCADIRKRRTYAGRG